MMVLHQFPSYEDAQKLGKVTVEYVNTPDECGIRVSVSGFEFKKAGSCRESGMKAVAWAIDALKTANESDRLAPGGTLMCVDTTGAPE